MDQFQNDSLNVSADEDGTSQRLELRDSLFLAAGLRLRGAESVEQVRVRNLSSGGMMAELPGRLETDVPVDVNVRGIGWIKGRVAWWTSGRVGIAFDDPIDPLAARKPVGTGTKTAAFVKPILPLR